VEHGASNVKAMGLIPREHSPIEFRSNPAQTCCLHMLSEIPYFLLSVGKTWNHGGHQVYSCLMIGEILLKPK